jgi:hypothetical protein
MSYSFSVRAATKAEALIKIENELGNVVTAQPIHAADREQAYAAAEAFLEIVPDDDSKDFQVSVHGSVGWTGEGDAQVITAAGVGVSVHLVPKEAAAA